MVNKGSFRPGNRIGFLQKKVPAEARFWPKVQKTDGCWLWTGAKNGAGYGQFWTGVERDRAHRFAYELANGAIPAGLVVCHRCDTPLCVRPDHLFLGTASENARDSVAKGRHYRASRTHCVRGHKYTAENTYRTGRHRSCRACELIKEGRQASLQKPRVYRGTYAS